MARLSLFLSEATCLAVDAEARTAGVTRSALVEQALAEYLDSRRKAREAEEARRRFAEALARADAIADALGDWDPVAIIREFRDIPHGRRREPKR
jgi:metal-responsive CopG/Arc/MetJ family transcriptional regulator